MSARLIVAAAAAYVAGVISGWSPTYMAQAFALAYGVSGSLDPNKQQRGPRLEDLKAPATSPGAPLPFIQGAVRTSGFVAWCSDKREIATTTSQDSKGGPDIDVTTYTYECDALWVLSDNEIAGIRRIWKNGELIWSIAEDADDETLAASAANDSFRSIRVYTGAADQLPDPLYEAAVQAENAPAYTGRGTVVIEGLQLLQGGQFPLIEFEVVSHGTYGDAALPAWAIDDETGLQPGTNQYVVTGDLGELYRGPDFDIAKAAMLAAYPSRTNFVGFYSSTNEVSSAYAQAGGAQATINDGSGAQYAYLTFYADAPSAIVWDGPAPGGSPEPFDVCTTGAPADNAPRLYSSLRSVGSSAAFNPLLRMGAGAAGYSLANYCDNYPPMEGGGLPGAWVSFPGVIRVERVPAAAGPPSAENQALSRLTPATLTLADVVSALCLRAGLEASDIDVTDLTAQVVRGIAVPGGSSARSALEVLRAAYFFDAREADKITFVRRGQAPVAALTWDELGAAGDPMQLAEPLPLMRANDDELPARWTIRYANASDDYQQGSETGDRVVTTSNAIQEVDLALSLMPAEAKAIAQATAIDAHVALTTSEAVLTQRRAALEPADVIQAPDREGIVWRFRIGRIDDSGALRKLALVLDEASAVAQLGTTDTSATGSTIVRPLGETILEALDIPLLRDSDNNAGYYVAATSEAERWRGASVFESLDDVTFAPAAQVLERGVIGTAQTALGAFAGSSGVFDEQNRVTVSVAGGELASYTRDAILNGTAPGYLIGAEIVQARSAIQQAPGVYVLSGLLRGRRGTEWAMDTHEAGERVVRLQMAGMRRIAHDAGELGVPMYLRGVTLGRALGTADSEAFTNSGEALRPFAPADIRVERSPAGVATITWKRRTRLSTRFTGSAGISAPLGEASEAYEVRIYANGTYASVVRTISSSIPSALYSASNQTADFGAPQATLYIGVRQLSAAVGAGHEGRAAG